MNNRPDNQDAQNTVLEAKALAAGYGERLVIPGLSLQITMGKITGLVGPNGSGKSTLAISFFRFVEFVSGQIIIDDVDVSTIGLFDLRSKLKKKFF